MNKRFKGRPLRPQLPKSGGAMKPQDTSGVCIQY